MTQSPSWWCKWCCISFSQDRCQWEGFWEVVRHVVSPFDLPWTLLVGGDLLVLSSLPGRAVVKQLMKWYLWFLARVGGFSQCASPKGIDLGYCDIEWFALETNRLFCRFWDCTQVQHFGLFCYYEGYSISSKGFLPLVVDIMAIWIKFTHSGPF